MKLKNGVLSQVNPSDDGLLSHENFKKSLLERELFSLHDNFKCSIVLIQQILLHHAIIEFVLNVDINKLLVVKIKTN